LRTFGYVKYAPLARGICAYCLLSELYNPDGYFQIISEYKKRLSAGAGADALGVLAAGRDPIVEDRGEQEKRKASIINSTVATAFLSLDLKLLSKVLTAMMLSHRIVVTSQSLETMSVFAYALLAMVHPLPWPGVFIPVLPSMAIEAIYAPFPFIVGVHSTMIAATAVPEMESFVLISLDECRIKYIRPAYKIPGYCRKRMMDFQNLVMSVGLGKAFREFILLVVGDVLKRDTRDAAGLAVAYNQMAPNGRSMSFERGILESQLIAQLIKEAEAGPGSEVHAAYWAEADDGAPRSRPSLPPPPPPVSLQDILARLQAINTGQTAKSIDEFVAERRAAARAKIAVVDDSPYSLKGRVAFFSRKPSIRPPPPAGKK
jgi:hypothetical protein